MEIVLIITGGIIIVSLFSAGFDYLSKRSKKVSTETQKTVVEMESRLSRLESKIEEREDRVLHLEEEVSFFKNLIEKK